MAETKFDFPGVEVPEMVRSFAEKGVQQAKDNYAKFKSAADQATLALEDTYVSASKGAAELNLKALDALRTNVNAAFDYTRELLAARTLADAVELSSAHVRKQFEVLSAQTRELAETAQKIAAETAEPLKASVEKNFRVQ
jgi:phasin